MKRILIPLATIAAMALAGSAVANATHHPTVKLSKTDLGKILIDGSGFTVYEFTKDIHNQDMCVKIDQCTGTWPPLTTHGKPVAGTGVKSSMLGTIALAHGVKQVSYAGHPLYTYRFEGSPPPVDTSYVGASQFGGSWYAINAAGHAVK